MFRLMLFLRNSSVAFFLLIKSNTSSIPPIKKIKINIFNQILKYKNTLLKLRLLIRDEFTNAKVRKKSKWEHVLTIKFLFHLKYNMSV